MASDDDRADDEAEDEAEDEDLSVDAASDPASAKRVKRRPSEKLQVFLADLRRRAAGLGADELQAEVDRLIDRMIDANVALAPQGLRDEVRARLREMIVDDPSFQVIVADLRSAFASEKR